jgi:hypothetical protein
MVAAIATSTNSVASECSSCNGLSVDKLGRRYLQAVPGQSITYTARVLASAKVSLSVLGDDGVTIDTAHNHCLAVDDPIHICFTDGVCTPLKLDPCLFVASVPATNKLTIKDSQGITVTMVSEAVIDPTPNDAGTPITGWIARAANLTGFEGKLSLRVNDARGDSLLGVGAIRSGRSQLQIKGDWSSRLSNGDVIKLNDFTGEISAFRALTTCNDVAYTVALLDTVADADIPFTDDYLVFHQPTPLTLDADSASPKCGWLTVNLPASETLKLLAYKQDCPVEIGTWAFTLAWGVQSLPAHMSGIAPIVWSHVFDGGSLIV